MKFGFCQVAAIAAGFLFAANGGSASAAASSQVVYSSFTEAGESAIYLHNTSTNGRVQLSETVPAGQTLEYFIVDAKAKTVAYLSDRTTTDVSELTAINVKTGLNETVSGPLVDGGDVVSMQFDAKGKYLFFEADKDVDGTYEIFRVDLKKKGVIQMTPNTLTADVEIEMYEALPKGDGVVYIADLLTDGKDELFVSKGADEPAQKLSNIGSNTEGEVVWFDINAKGSAAIFIGDLDVAGQYELYYVDLKKGGVKKLNGALPEGGSVVNASFDPKGKTVVYVADQDVADKNELYKVDIKSATSTRISENIGDDRDVQGNFAFDVKGKFVTYLANATNILYSDVYRLDLKTGESVKITGSAGKSYGANMDSFGNVYHISNPGPAASIDFFGVDMKTNTETRIDDSTANAHVYSANIDLKGTGAVYWTLSMTTFSFDTVYFNAATQTRTSLTQPGESIGQFKLLNSSEIALQMAM